jgi:biotin carboxylase
MKIDKKRLLIAGGGYADIPLILSAKKLDYYVITSGNRPDELGHRYSDEYQPADFSNPEAILDLAKRLKVSAICACCNDFSALSAAYAAEQLGLPGHDPYHVAQIIHHKDQYRQFALEHGITSPKALGFTNRKDALNNIKSLSFPVMVKPVDLTGGKGMSTIREIGEAEAAIEKALAISRTKRIVVEEFVVGSRHGFSVFLVNGQVVFFFSDNEHYYLNPYLVSAASVPSIASSKVEQKLCVDSEKIASLLSLKTGIFHIQYILRGEEPVIIEICRRAPGDLYVKLVEHATGVDYPSWIVKASAGLDCSGLVHAEPKGFFTRHCIMSASVGKVKDVIFDKSIEKQIIDRFMWWKKGDVVSDVMTAKFGIVFLQFQSQDEMLEKTERMQELIQVVTE